MKTTTTVNLAAGLAKVGQRVLMVDLDPQGNATMGSGVDKRKLELTVYDVLLESASIAEARAQSDKLKAGGCSYDILGANRELAGAEVELVEVERRERRLKQALAAVEGEYDFVLIDCPPSLSMLTLNGLCCASMEDFATNPEKEKTRKGAGYGAAAGAVVGLLSAGNNPFKSAMIGAAAGALVGGSVGYYQDKQEAKLRQQMAGTGVDVVRKGDNITLDMPGGVTFAFNSADLNALLRTAHL